ncbi:MAG: TldD/PmbA family protein [Clostridia bacterium]|nr:TldD/PmbA family protein [Clostridia bacterium]
MNFEKVKEILFAEAKKAGLVDDDVYFRMSSDASAEALNRELSACTSGTAGGVCFRCAVDGRIGSASSQCLEADEIAALVPRAIANAGIIDADEEPIFFEGSGEGAYRTVTVKVPELPDAAELRHAVLDLQEKLYGASELMTDGTCSSAGAAVTEMSLANSKGLSLSHRTGMRYTYAEAIVNDGKEPSFGSAFAATLEPDDIAEKATKEALARLGAGTVKTGTYDVIFEAPQVRSLLGTFAGIFSGKNAMLGLSLLAGKEGETIAADCLTLVDDPFYPENTVQMPFDAEGVATKEKNLIENGVLKTLLYDLTYAKKAGKTTTGNAKRGSIADPVSIAPYCLRIAPGAYTPDSLREKMGNGLYITELKGLHAGADDVTGDFSIESAGFLVENGKVTKPVHTFTVAGNFFQLLKSIDGVADNVKMGIPSATVMAAPDLLVRGLSVAGE